MSRQTLDVSLDSTATDLWDWPLQHEDGVVHVHNGHDCWEVALEVAFFRPGEIEINLSGDHLFIFCHHEERGDEHGWVKREMHRSYRVPEDVDTGTIRSHYSWNGILQLKALKKNATSRRSSIDVEVVAEEKPKKKKVAPKMKYGPAAIEKPGKNVLVEVENAKNGERQRNRRHSIFATAEHFCSPQQMPLGPFGWSWYNVALNAAKSC
ncbi:hypothetical protein niasHT_011841 [Heterodera trifolii]|uniref:SHSP domain-containing protein n=1 Tax=Heterodera trifolii TaxID=157864 RepID=A0ABD2L5H4_9BILA